MARAAAIALNADASRTPERFATNRLLTIFIVSFLKLLVQQAQLFFLTSGVGKGLIARETTRADETF